MVHTVVDAPAGRAKKYVQMLLVDTERGPRTALDAACVSLLKARGEDGKYKTCDECGREDVEDDSLEVKTAECQHKSSHTVPAFLVLFKG